MTAMVRTWPKGLLILFVFTLTLYSCSSEDTDVLLTDPEISSDETSDDTDDTTTDDDTDDSTDDTTDDNTDDSDDTQDDTTSDDEGNDDSNDNTDEGSDTEGSSCTNPLDYVFNEKDGLVLVEFEDAQFPSNWKLKSNGNKFSGEGYMVWEGNQFFNDPGTGKATFKIKITNPGTYRFLWYNAVKTGNDGTEHNDTWLRFDDAADFYGQKGTSKVYPKGSGKSPNPNGASKNGWMKIYRSGNNLDFIWQARTSDHDAHDIFVKFNTAGTYVMEVSARSSGHAIDKFVLFKNSMTLAEATSSTVPSVITCN